MDDEERAKKEIRAGFKSADIVKISEEEMAFVTGFESFEESASYILGQGPKLVLITKGEDGCFYTDGSRSGHIGGHRMPVVETTGAGDAFVAGLLAKLLERHDQAGRFELAADETTVGAIRFANAAGALAVTKIGAIPAMPRRQMCCACLKGGSAMRLGGYVKAPFDGPEEWVREPDESGFGP